MSTEKIYLYLSVQQFPKSEIFHAKHVISKMMYNNIVSWFAEYIRVIRVSSGQGKVGEIPYQAKVKEFYGSGKIKNDVKSQGIVREFWTGHGYGGFMSNLKHFGQHPHSLLMELLASVTDKMSCATLTVIWYATGFELTRDTSYLALMGKLWSAFF